MKKFLVSLPLMALLGNASGQACWNEFERDGEWLITAGQCTENVSIPDVRLLCRSHSKSDTPRTAATCPSIVKDFRKGGVSVEAVEFRCMGLQPPAAGGSANIFHYGLSKDPFGLEIVRTMCVKLGGKWETAKGAK